MLLSLIPIPTTGKVRLQNAHQSSAFELAQLDADLAKLFSEKVRLFIEAHDIKKVDAISSHGHTVFHQPLSSFHQADSKRSLSGSFNRNSGSERF